MKQLALALVLAALSGSAAAAWVLLGSSDTANVYVDPGTIRRSDGLVKMWNLYDFKTAQVEAGRKAYLSNKQQSEYDCKEEQSRVLYFSLHSGQMGAGNVVYSHSEPANWAPVPPGSVSEAFWQFACSEK